MQARATDMQKRRGNHLAVRIIFSATPHKRPSALHLSSSSWDSTEFQNSTQDDCRACVMISVNDWLLLYRRCRASCTQHLSKASKAIKWSPGRLERAISGVCSVGRAAGRSHRAQAFRFQGQNYWGKASRRLLHHQRQENSANLYVLSCRAHVALPSE